MKTKEVVEFFGTAADAGKAIGITGQAVSQWKENVPRNRVKSVELAMQIELFRRAIRPEIFDMIRKQLD